MRSSFLLVVIEVTPVSFAIFLSSARVSPASWLNPSLGCWWRICPRSLRCISGCGASASAGCSDGSSGAGVSFRLRGCRRFFGLRLFGTGFSALFRAEDGFLARLLGLLYAASALRGLLLLGLRRLRRGRGFGLFFFLSSAARLRLFFTLRRGRLSCVASFLFDLRLFAVRGLRGRGLPPSLRRLGSSSLFFALRWSIRRLILLSFLASR